MPYTVHLDIPPWRRRKSESQRVPPRPLFPSCRLAVDFCLLFPSSQIGEVSKPWLVCLVFFFFPPVVMSCLGWRLTNKLCSYIYNILTTQTLLPAGPTARLSSWRSKYNPMSVNLATPQGQMVLFSYTAQNTQNYMIPQLRWLLFLHLKKRK